MISLTFNFSMILTVPCSWTPSKVINDVSGCNKKNIHYKYLQMHNPQQK